MSEISYLVSDLTYDFVKVVNYKFSRIVSKFHNSVRFKPGCGILIVVIAFGIGKVCIKHRH